MYPSRVYIVVAVFIPLLHRKLNSLLQKCKGATLAIPHNQIPKGVPHGTSFEAPTEEELSVQPQTLFSMSVLAITVSRYDRTRATGTSWVAGIGTPAKRRSFGRPLFGSFGFQA